MGLAKRLQYAVAILVMVFMIGTAGYKIIGLTWIDSVYMTLISLTTVGYGEMLPEGKEVLGPGARVFTMILLVTGMGVLLYVFSSATAFIVEGELTDILKKRKMEKKIAEMDGHTIVCGLGKIGRYIIGELQKTLRPFVVIDHDKASIEHHQELLGEFLYILGDASEDAVLVQAGIDRASGVVTTFGDDKMNLFVTLSARTQNANARIVARAVDASSGPKLTRSGANSVVSTNLIGGLRLVSELVRPAVTSFLDIMLRERSMTLRVEEAHVGPGSDIAGKKIEEANIQERTGLAVVAVKQGKTGDFTYAPKGDFLIHEGDTLIVLGDVHNLPALRKLACSP